MGRMRSRTAPPSSACTGASRCRAARSRSAMLTAALAPPLWWSAPAHRRSSAPWSVASAPASNGARKPSTAATMPACRSPVMVGADAASPHPTSPFSASMRTIRFSACSIRTPAISIGLTSGNATGIASTRLTIRGGASGSSLGLAAISIVSIRSGCAHRHARRRIGASASRSVPVNPSHRPPRLPPCRSRAQADSASARSWARNSTESGLRGRGRSIEISSATCPGRGVMTITRSERNAASRTLWVTKTTVFRVSVQTSTTRRWSADRVCASSAPKGSSISRMSGSRARARAMPTRCFMPPERRCG